MPIEIHGLHSLSGTVSFWRCQQLVDLEGVYFPSYATGSEHPSGAHAAGGTRLGGGSRRASGAVSGTWAWGERSCC